MDGKKIESDILAFVRPAYPEIQVRVELSADDPTKAAIYFVDPKFASLYPLQRYHYLSHLIPADYRESHLEGSVWFELAPGEKPEDLCYPDEELIAGITSDVLGCLTGAGFFASLDDALCPVDPNALVPPVTATTARRGLSCWRTSSAKMIYSMCFTS